MRDFLGSMMITVRAPDGGDPGVDDLIQAAADGARGRSRLAAEPEPLTAADILLLTGTVRYNLADHERSLADFEDALALLEPRHEVATGELARVHWELGRHAKRQGRPDEMLAHVRRAVELNERWNAPSNERLRARISLGEALLHVDRDEAEAVFRALVEEIRASELKDTVRHINALNGLSIAMSGPGKDPRARLPIQEERLRIARLIYHDDGGGLTHTLSDVTHTFRQLGMLERAEALARESVAVADRTRQNPVMFQGMSRCTLGLVLLQQGRQAEALEVLGRSDELLQQGGENHISRERCSTSLAYAAAAAGHYPRALEALAISQQLLALNKRQRHPDAVAACGLAATVAVRRGAYREASATLQGCAPDDPAKAPLPWQLAQAELLLVQSDAAAAGPLLADLRGQHAPAANQREWMRPWMLSAWQARLSGDAAGDGSLRQALGGFATIEPLAGCLAAPAAETCLALP
ncbi:MAG: tetratricopeptide repeat protein [Pseudoxanthomonas suwonensis]|nr:tetratricopeptide repeat protein [Pseudoxanthomonas suwonensis]